jgi:hypothetical protein
LEVANRIWRSVAEKVGAFLDEAAFRLELAFDILRGKVPRETEKRFWNRNAEVPVAVDILDGINTRRIATILIWPPLESAEEDALYDHMLRVDEIKRVIAKGCTEMAWQTLLEVDYGLVFDAERACWVASDGFVYDASFARRRDDLTHANVAKATSKTNGKVG